MSLLAVPGKIIMSYISLVLLALLSYSAFYFVVCLGFHNPWTEYKVDLYFSFSPFLEQNLTQNEQSKWRPS